MTRRQVFGLTGGGAVYRNALTAFLGLPERLDGVPCANNELRISSSMAASGICCFHAGTACSLHSGIDHSQQTGGPAVDGDKDDALPALPQSVRPFTERIDRQAKFGEALGITDDNRVARGSTRRQCEQFVLVAAVERHNRDKGWFQHGSKIATGLRTSPSGRLEFLL
jgi:hypothetical protein